MTITSTASVDMSQILPAARLNRPLAAHGCDCLCDRQVISALIDHGLIEAPQFPNAPRWPDDFPEPDAEVDADAVHLLTKSSPMVLARHVGVWKASTVERYILERLPAVLEARRQATMEKKTRQHREDIAELARQAARAEEKAKEVAAALRKAKRTKEG